MEGRMVNSELTAKTAVAGVADLRAATERSHGELSAILKTGHEETVKLRQDITDYKAGNDKNSSDLFNRLFATLDEMKNDQRATSQELHQIRADNRENRAYVNASAGLRTPSGARWNAPGEPDVRGTPMDGTGEENNEL